MASIYKHKSNKWVAAVRKQGCKTITKSFTKHSDARHWANQIELDIHNQKELPNLCKLHDVFDRFEREVIPSYKSQKTARWMLNFMKRHLRNDYIHDVKPQDIANYRDKRLQSNVSGSSINKELNILARLFDIAISEWGYSSKKNPVRDVLRPKNGKARTRRPSQTELSVLESECISSGNKSIWYMIMFAIETGMRQSEILQLKLEDIDIDQNIARLHDTKNGESRDVPLSNMAISIIHKQRGDTAEGRLFNNWSSGDGFRSTFRRITARCNIQDLRFHDFRHEAASRLFEKGLNQFQVAAITGHKSLQSLQRYTHLKAVDLVRLLT